MAQLAFHHLVVSRGQPAKLLTTVVHESKTRRRSCGEGLISYISDRPILIDWGLSSLVPANEI